MQISRKYSNTKLMHSQYFSLTTLLISQSIVVAKKICQGQHLIGSIVDIYFYIIFYSYSVMDFDNLKLNF